jgi:hypothetical protein
MKFRQLYPAYRPKGGLRGFLLAYWDHYVNSDGSNA